MKVFPWAFISLFFVVNANEIEPRHSEAGGGYNHDVEWIYLTINNANQQFVINPMLINADSSPKPYQSSSHVNLHQTRIEAVKNLQASKISPDLICGYNNMNSIWMDDKYSNDFTTGGSSSAFFFRKMVQTIKLKSLTIIDVTSSSELGFKGCLLPTELEDGMDFDVIGNTGIIANGFIDGGNYKPFKTLWIEDMLISGNINKFLNSDGKGFKAHGLETLVLKDTLMTGDLSLVNMIHDTDSGTLTKNFKPADVGWTGLEKLKWLDLSNANGRYDTQCADDNRVECGKFIGTIPLSWNYLRDIEYLDISGNNLDGFAVGWTWNFLPNLKHLDVSNNPEFEMDVAQMTGLDSLEVLEIANTKIIMSNIDLFALFPKLKRVSVVLSHGEFIIPKNTTQVSIVGKRDIRPTNRDWKCTELYGVPTRCSDIPNKMECISEDGENCFNPSTDLKYKLPNGQDPNCEQVIKRTPFRRYLTDDVTGYFVDYDDCVATATRQCNAWEGHCVADEQCAGTLVCSNKLTVKEVPNYFDFKGIYFNAEETIGHNAKQFCIPMYLKYPNEPGTFVTKDPEDSFNTDGSVSDSVILGCEWDTKARVWCAQSGSTTTATWGGNPQKQDRCVQVGGDDPYGMTYISITDTMMGGHFAESLRLLKWGADPLEWDVSPIEELHLINTDFSGTLNDFTVKRYPNLRKLTLRNNRFVGDKEDIRDVCMFDQELPKYDDGTKTLIRLERPMRVICQTINGFSRSNCNNQQWGYNDIIFRTRKNTNTDLLANVIHIKDLDVDVTNSYPLFTYCGNRVMLNSRETNIGYEHCISEPTMKDHPWFVEFEVNVPYEELVSISIVNNDPHELFETELHVNGIKRATIRGANHHYNGESMKDYTSGAPIQSAVNTYMFANCIIDEPLVYDSYEKPDDYALRIMKPHKGLTFNIDIDTKMSTRSNEVTRVEFMIKSWDYILSTTHGSGFPGRYSSSFTDCDLQCQYTSGCGGFLHDNDACLLMRPGFVDWDNPMGASQYKVTHDVFGMTPLKDSINPPPVGTKLEKCEGECDKHSDCKAGLLCWQRGDGIMPHDHKIPGCINYENSIKWNTGDSDLEAYNWDYCWDPEEAWQLQQYSVYVAADFKFIPYKPRRNDGSVIIKAVTLTCKEPGSGIIDLPNQKTPCLSAVGQCSDLCSTQTDFPNNSGGGCYGFTVDIMEVNPVCLLLSRRAFEGILDETKLIPEPLHGSLTSHWVTSMLVPWGTSALRNRGLTKTMRNLHTFWENLVPGSTHINNEITPAENEKDDIPNPSNQMFKDFHENKIAWMGMKCKESCEQSPTCTAWEFCYPQGQKCPDLCYTYEHDGPPTPKLENTYYKKYAGVIKESSHYQVAFNCDLCFVMGYTFDRCNCGVCGSTTSDCANTCHAGLTDRHVCVIIDDGEFYFNALIGKWLKDGGTTTCTDVPGFYDDGGPLYNCRYYSGHASNCDWADHNRNLDLPEGQQSATEACCSCGGGTTTTNSLESIGVSSIGVSSISHSHTPHSHNPHTTPCSNSPMCGKGSIPQCCA